MKILKKRQKQVLSFVVHLLRRKRIPFQITGGLAAKIYGADRPLKDIDIDLPDHAIDALAPLVSEYITDGPRHFVGYGFDLYLLELHYHGQQIDLCGHDHMKLFDRKNKKWVRYPGKLLEALRKRVDDLLLPIIPPKHLISYKKLLCGKHHQIDVVALKKYLK